MLPPNEPVNEPLCDGGGDRGCWLLAKPMGMDVGWVPWIGRADDDEEDGAAKAEREGDG